MKFQDEVSEDQVKKIIYEMDKGGEQMTARGFTTYLTRTDLNGPFDTNKTETVYQVNFPRNFFLFFLEIFH